MYTFLFYLLLNSVNYVKSMNAPEYCLHQHLTLAWKKGREMGGVIAPSASVTGTSVPWQILLPVDLHSSRAGRHPPQTADRNVSSSPPPSPWLESIHCCSWSYYRYAPAKCKTSICHLSAHSSMKTFHYAMPLPASSTSSTHDFGAILVHLRPSGRKFDQLGEYHL